MTEVVEIEKETKVLHWLPLPVEALEAQGLEIGDWVLIRPSNGGLSIEKIKTERVDMELEKELVEKVLIFRDMEGYYTLEEALSNLIRKGLVYIYRERGEEEEAEKIDNSWMVQIHPG